MLTSCSRINWSPWPVVSPERATVEAGGAFKYG